MQEQDNFGKFVKDFYDYATKRIKNGGAPDVLACDKIIAIHQDPLLRQQLLNIDLEHDLPNILTENYWHFMYVYLINKYNGDSLKEKRLRDMMHDMREGQVVLESILLSFSYNHVTRQFTTNDLWINLAETIKQKEIGFGLWLFLFIREAFPSPAVLSDYRANNAITFIKAIPLTNFVMQDIPFYLVFEHPDLNEDIYKFVLWLMSDVLKPHMLLSCFKPPKNKDYRLLNYCVEQIVKLDENYFVDAGNLSHSEDREELQKLWDKILFCVPAALYYRDKSAECNARAARCGYKPAIARCLVRNIIYRDSKDECFDDIQSLWAEGYMSTADALKAIASYGVDKFENYFSTQCFPAYAGSIHAAGMTFIIPSKTPYFARRIHVLSELCAANHLMFVNAILYRLLNAFISSENDSSLPVDRILAVIDNIQCVLREPALARQWLSRLQAFTLSKQQSSTARLIAAQLESEDPQEAARSNGQVSLQECFKGKSIHLSVLFRAIESLIDLEQVEHHHLQEWLYTDFGALFIQQYIYHCLSLSDEHEIKPFAAKTIGVLVSVNLNHLTAWSFELMCMQLALAMPFDQQLNACCQKFKNKLQEMPRAIDASVKEPLVAQKEAAVVSELPEGRWFPSFGESAFASLVKDYENELLQGTMTKERYQHWLSATQRFISHNKFMHSLDLSNSIVIDFIGKLLCWHDWSMLATIWKLNGDSRFISLKEFLKNKSYDDEAKENMQSILHVTKFTIMPSAPAWWQEAQSECFKNLQLKKQQLSNLCKVLLEKFAELPTTMGVIPSFLGFLAPQAKNLTLKNDFVNMVEKLCSSLSDNRDDVLTVVSKFVQEAAHYRYRLISNDSQRYLEHLNAFFGVAKDCTEQEFEKSIESKLLRCTTLQNVGGGLLISSHSLPSVSESSMLQQQRDQHRLASAAVPPPKPQPPENKEEKLADARHLAVVEELSNVPPVPSENPSDEKVNAHPERKSAMSI